MRLDKIKLAGFKSFVDPTTIPLPGNLVGIVGPNGCGKSNVIDAVRWVMGESSARQLRGDTMADVIFNGSSTRRPVGLASVELVFDNAAGTAPGEFAKYPQIAIKRQVTREGQSVYLLNGTRCRRKDITDLFLGTGLSTRSYAIIEQGTISRLIEARPDELREILEEAAGISKYKERRHETELRMAHTRENLERLRDLRDEVGKQLEALRRQAKKADKYTAWKAEERRYKEQLLALRWRKFDEQWQAHHDAAAEGERLFRERHEDARAIAAALEYQRAELEALHQTLNAQQCRYYELGAEISRLDQAIQHARETRSALLQEQARLGDERDQASADLETDRQHLELIRTDLAACDQSLEAARANEAEAAARRDTAAGALAEGRRFVEMLNADVGRWRSQAEIQQARLRQLDQQGRQFEARRERLQRERDELEKTLARETSDQLGLEAAELEAQRTDTQARIEQLAEQIQAERRGARECQDQLNASRAELHAISGTISSLETLQEHAMGKDRAGLRQWLSERELERAGRLAEFLEVHPGWETAVESVLGNHLQALCVDATAPYLPHLGAIADESLSLFETGATGRKAPSHAGDSGPAQAEAGAGGAGEPLLGRVRSPWDLKPLLGAVYCAEDIASAQELSARLADHESAVTRDGIRLGPGWLAVARPENGKTGVLKRERDLREMKARRDGLLERIQSLQCALAEAEETVRRAEQEREDLQGEDRRLAAEHAAVRAELSAAAARCEQADKRLRHTRYELNELADQAVQHAEETAEARTLLLEADERLGELEPRTAELIERRGQLETGLDEAESALLVARERLNGLLGRQESLASTEALTRKHLERAQCQFEQARDRLEAVSAQIGEAGTPDGHDQVCLDGLLEQRAQAERGLGELRRLAGEVDAEIRRQDEARLRNEQELEAVKQHLEQTRLELQANAVRRQTVQEQFEELGADPATVMAGLPPEAEEKEWQQRANDLAAEIARLGAVNLTAMEEYQVQDQRMQFLDQQHRDLTDSLEILQSAIEKIDRECRARFRHTFDQVNAGLHRMFPKLFGGGEASLELADRDHPDTGVTVMARPPGKRNSSIHLLSGGEKALTAVALVFAIFELNPAPFCLLDEVDAPLDDANVGRFGELVKEMSEKVQFLFISHNKATMEIAQHLAGVTMKEPGVSRIVAVDLDAAVELAVG